MVDPAKPATGRPQKRRARRPALPVRGAPVDNAAVPALSEQPSSGPGVGTAPLRQEDAEPATVEAWRQKVAELEARLAACDVNQRAMREELEAFTASVSHDLRAPLRSIDGFSQALLEDYAERLDATAVDYLQRIRRAAQRQAALLDSLLEFAQVGRRELSCRRVDLSALVRSVLAELAQLEPERHVTVTIQEGLEVHGDWRLLYLIFQNLVSNAWKFTRRRPDATIRVYCRDQDGRRELVVQDNGVGFDPARAHELFQAFHRLHSSDEFPGSGLGLAIVHRAVQRSGGTISAELTPGGGARFVLAMG